MLIKAERNHHKSNIYDSWFYQIESETLSVGGILLYSRYPEQGFALSKVSDCFVLVLDGSGVQGDKIEQSKIMKGDFCFIPKNTHYFFDVAIGGEMKLWMINQPKFNYSDHTIEDLPVEKI